MRGGPGGRITIPRRSVTTNERELSALSFVIDTYSFEYTGFRHSMISEVQGLLGIEKIGILKL